MDLTHAGQTRFKDEEDLSQELEEIQRYSLGNQLRAGFFGQDACVQTDVSELLLVKCLSDEMAALVKEMELLKKEIPVKVKFIEAQYESRLQQEAETFYTRINYKVKAFENHYKEKVIVLRNSYRQQLADALEVIKATYRDGGVFDVVPSDTGRVQELLNQLQEKDFKIESLNNRLRDYEEKALLEISSEPADDLEKEWLRMENGKLKDDVNALHLKMEQIRQALEAKDQSLKDLALNVSQLKSEAEGDKKSLQKLANEKDQLKVQLDLEKEMGKKQIAQLKQEKEKETESFTSSYQNMGLAFEKRYEEERLAEQERQKARELLAQEAKLNAQDAQRAAVPVEPVLKDKELDWNNKELAEEVKKLRNEEKSQKLHIERLEKQISTISQAWQKKFEILRQNFHAVKDEMYLRQSLQRQAAALHQASVSYIMGTPVPHQGQHPEEANVKKACFSTKTPLPSIGAREMQRRKTVDIHLPSGQTDAFSAEESQLVSEEDSDEEPTKISPHLQPPNQLTSFHTTLQSSLNV